MILDKNPIASLTPWDGWIFDPGGYIRLVNQLRQGQPGVALQLVTEFASTTTDPEESTKAFFLLRLLFVTNDGAPAPAVRVGAPLDASPPTAAAFPMYPLALVRDVPLLIVPGFDLSGFPEPVESHVAFFAANGHLRPTPLDPPPNPMPLADELLASPVWHRTAADRNQDRRMLRGQLQRLLAP